LPIFSVFRRKQFLKTKLGPTVSHGNLFRPSESQRNKRRRLQRDPRFSFETSLPVELDTSIQNKDDFVFKA
jgi:hypothetical protein